MINSSNLRFGILSVACAAMLTACTSRDDIIDEIEPDHSQRPHTCELDLNVTMAGYDDEPDKTRADFAWAEGDKIYLTFTVGEGTSYGDAVYKSGKWSVSYYGDLPQGTSAKCKAVYFDNADYVSGTVINLTENTGIYEDASGSYLYNGGSLSVTAALRPKTGRIRFAGSDNEEITVYGLSHYTSYDCSTGSFVSTPTAVSEKVSGAYTPYIYGDYAEGEVRRLNVITAESGFVRVLPSSIFNAGQSGYMTIPKLSSYSGWQNVVIVSVSGVDFTMIPVSYGEGNFLLAETETTEQLYNAIIDTTPKDSQLPKTYIRNSEWQSAINKLVALTGLEFRLPTLEEWQYAYIGGNKSKGYTYSGSNVITDVAWYSGNSGTKTHEVKQLQPNELGFYDMSGNVSELTEQTDSFVYWYGGNYSVAETSCLKTSRTYTDYGATTGARLALSN